MSVDRLLGSLRAIVREEAPQATFSGTYEYRIVAVRGARIDAAPASTLPLPAISDLLLTPSVLGEVVAGVKIGQLVLVQFAGTDPTHPEIVGLSSASAMVTIDASEALSIGDGAEIVELAGGGAPVSRVGDEISIFLPLTPVPVSGVITLAGVPTYNIVGTLTFLGPASGMIIAGNPRALA
jgi:hypothetical protein